MGQGEITKGSSNIPGRIYKRSWVIGSGLFDVANRSLQQSLGKSLTLSLSLSLLSCEDRRITWS